MNNMSKFLPFVLTGVLTLGMLNSCGKDGNNENIAVTGISLGKTAMTLTIGEAEKLTANITPANATNRIVAWSSNATNIATVSSDGTVTAIATGTAVVTATTVDGGKVAACNVTVNGAAVPVTSVSLNKGAISIEVGGKETLTATVLPRDASNKNLKWSSSNTAVATVSGGTVTALTTGMTTIAVTTDDGGKTASCTVSVVTKLVPVTGVSLNSSSLNLQVGNSGQLVATVSPGNATNRSVNWSSLDMGVATVDENGKVTAVAPGSVKITAQTVDGSKTATCNITVIPVQIPVSGVSLNESSVNLPLDDAIRLTATVLPENATNKNITWSSSNTSVASVDSNGNITARAYGMATITVKTADGDKTATCNVTVPKILVTSVSLNKTAVSLFVGGSETLTATVLPNNAFNKSVTWSSNDTAIATVDQYGKVTARSSGTATITIASVDGNKTATSIVNVIAPVTSVSLNKPAISLLVGDTETLIATVQPTNASNKAVTWSSANPSIAMVDANGRVTALSPGTTSVTVKTVDGGKTFNCDITVYEATNDGVLVGGLIWAKRNVGTPGTFVAKPEDYGGYYTYYETQTVCPVGWRLPITADFQSLANSGSVWTTVSGVNGRRFGSGSNTIFLPAAGYWGWTYSDDKHFYSVGSSGVYMSSERYYHLMLYNNSVSCNFISDPISSTVRCVKD